MNAHDFDTFDRCGRRFAFEQEWEPRRISPLGLLYAGIEGGIISSDSSQGTFDAIREITTRKDVQSGNLEPISAVRHIGFMAEVISLALVRKFGRFRRIEPVPFGAEQWQSNLFEAKGELHRIVLCAYLDDDTMRSFAHSWGTVGELAALQRDVTLVAVVVGPQRAGRRHSHWTKAYRHPVQKSMLRFGRRKGGKGSGFTDQWVEVWRERTDISAATWLDKMRDDDVLDDLIATHRIPHKDERVSRIRESMFKILPQMEQASEYDPMRLHSCDDPIRGVCPFSPCCWSPTGATVEELAHLYRASASS